MAAYATTTTIAHRRPIKIGEDLAVLAGTIDVTNYNSTLAEITAISKKFKTVLAVVVGGVSSNGYLGTWVAADKAVKCFYPSKALAAHTHVLHFQTSAAANAVTAAANQLRTAAAAFDIAGVVDSAGEGGVVQAAATAAQAGTEVANDVNVGVLQFIAVGLV